MPKHPQDYLKDALLDLEGLEDPDISTYSKPLLTALLRAKIATAYANISIAERMHDIVEQLQQIDERANLELKRDEIAIR